MSAQLKNLLSLLVAMLLLCISARAHALTRLYVIAIGNNQPPVADDAGLQTLRYADDDAASVAELGGELGARVTVLSVLDRASQRRFPRIAQQTRAPSLTELRRTVAWHRQEFERVQRAGDDPILILFFSGHGTRGGNGPPALAMQDGPLTPAVLYDEVLATLPARFIHLLVDACHAEAVVRTRDLEAATIPVSILEEQQVIEKTSLARFPNVGAIVATARGAESFEWDAIEKGVFTHELLSAMRGAADVNRDGKIEYSEVTAFINAANREVLDTRAKLSVLVRPPALDARVALTTLSAARHSATLKGAGRTTESLSVEDERGVRLADWRVEAGFPFSLIVPSGRLLYVRKGGNEAALRPSQREKLELDAVSWRPRAVRARGALESSLRKGLFATPFGPLYYRGFIDAHPELPSVDFDSRPRAADEGTTDARPNNVLIWGALGTGAVLAAGSATFSVLAIRSRNEASSADTERKGTAARDDFIRNRALALGVGVGAGVAVGIGLWALLSGAEEPSAASDFASVSFDPLNRSMSVRTVW